MLTSAGRTAALAALALAASSSALAGPLTLGTAAELALAQFPSLAAARAEREVAAAESAEVRSLFLPNLALTFAATQFEEPAPVSPIHGFRPDLFPQFSRTLLSPRLSAGYTLFDGGLRRARAAQNEARLGGAGSQVLAAELDVLARTGRSFLAVRSLAEMLAADQARLAALEVEHRRARELVDSGKAAAVELSRAEAARASAEAEQVVRRARLEQAEWSLARLTGLDVEETRAGKLAAVSDELPPLAPRAGLEAQALAAHPALAAARHRIAEAEAAVEAARAGRRPVVQASAQETGYGSGEGDFTAEWSAGVSLTWSLADGGAAAARMARAEAALAAAKENLRTLELQTLSELDAALTAVAEAEARGRSLESAVASYAEVARIERLRLEAEAGTQSDYLDAEADLLAARAARAEARGALASARIDVARLVGELSLTWLEVTFEQAREVVP